MLKFLIYIVESTIDPIIIAITEKYQFFRENIKIDIHFFIGIIVAFVFFLALSGKIEYFAGFSEGMSFLAKYHMPHKSGSIYLPITVAIWILLFKRGPLLIVAYPLIILQWFLMLQF